MNRLAPRGRCQEVSDGDVVESRPPPTNKVEVGNRRVERESVEKERRVVGRRRRVVVVVVVIEIMMKKE